MLVEVIVIRASRLVPGSSDLGSGSLPRPPRLGALPAVPRHPVRALALLRAVPRAGAAGGAVAAPLEVLLPAARRRRGQAGGRHAACAAAPQARYRQRRGCCRRKGGARCRARGTPRRARGPPWPWSWFRRPHQAFALAHVRVSRFRACKEAPGFRPAPREREIRFRVYKEAPRFRSGPRCV
jgi:hypothetical protein